MPGKKALVRRPGPRLADGPVTHAERREVDVDLAVEQEEAYVGTLRAHGWAGADAPTRPVCGNCGRSSNPWAPVWPPCRWARCCT